MSAAHMLRRRRSEEVDEKAVRRRTDGADADVHGVDEGKGGGEADEGCMGARARQGKAGEWRMASYGNGASTGAVWWGLLHAGWARQRGRRLRERGRPGVVVHNGGGGKARTRAPAEALHTCKTSTSGCGAKRPGLLRNSSRRNPAVSSARTSERSTAAREYTPVCVGCSVHDSEVLHGPPRASAMDVLRGCEQCIRAADDLRGMRVGRARRAEGRGVEKDVRCEHPRSRTHPRMRPCKSTYEGGWMHACTDRCGGYGRRAGRCTVRGRRGRGGHEGEGARAAEGAGCGAASTG
ncbi:hypothetical protein DFH09DRAFT_1220021 [Mycena vulgaris]|nr:hypothetical protein DFH09DRAFT_1220021 [Mycena vulgaris]